MKARKYFEAQGRRDLGYLPDWARNAYAWGWTYQEQHPSRIRRR